MEAVDPVSYCYLLSGKSSSLENGIDGSEVTLLETGLLRQKLIGKRLFVFLDYDGTLTPIVKNPEDALLSDEMRDLLVDLSSYCTVGIVTGRALKTIKRFVQIDPVEGKNFLYAASHGFHIESNGGDIQHQVGEQFIPHLKSAAEEINAKLKDIPGYTIEDNEFAVSVHYRNVPTTYVPYIESTVDQVVKERSSYLKKGHGKMVFEVRLNVPWDKGSAVLWLLEALGVSPFDERIALLYVGDDITDEDAFKALNKGLCVLVSSEPRPTAANLRVENPSAVYDLLTELLRAHQDGDLMHKYVEL